MAKEHLRVKKIDARFTPDEYKIIEGLAAGLGLSKTDLVRRRLLENGPQIIVDAKAMLTELNRIGSELGRSGNNINQLARHANILKKKNSLPPGVIERFNTLFAGYLEQLRMLEVALRKILRNVAN
jgi:hypothetical protein